MTDWPVQGTEVLVDVTVRDPDTKAPTDPADFQFTVVVPGQSPTTTTWRGGQVERLDVGRFRLSLDTSPASGYYQYEAAAVGGGVGVRVQRAFQVKPALGPT